MNHIKCEVSKCLNLRLKSFRYADSRQPLYNASILCDIATYDTANEKINTITIKSRYRNVINDYIDISASPIYEGYWLHINIAYINHLKYIPLECYNLRLELESDHLDMLIVHSPFLDDKRVFCIHHSIAQNEHYLIYLNCWRIYSKLALVCVLKALKANAIHATDAESYVSAVNASTPALEDYAKTIITRCMRKRLVGGYAVRNQ
jgi:hypothetical protein